jgi:predicted  nucleic acid-binding Zn-ribbon protein
VPDDERTRRRLGDATRSRIDDLASGWSLEAPVTPAVAPPGVDTPDTPGTPETPDTPDTVDDDHPPAPPVPAFEPAGRKRPRTMPPPPPGSTARKALEEAIVETKSSEVPRLQLADVVTPPPARVVAAVPASAPKKPPTKPPPIPQRAKTSARTANLEHTPPVIIEAALIEEHPSIATELAAGKSGALQAAVRSANPHLTGPVPIGEFDSGSHPVDDEKLRVAHAHATQQHHTADALLGIPPQPRTVVKETPISVLLDETAARITIDTAKPTHDPSTTRFERGDPTSEGRDDATEIQAPSERKPGGGGGGGTLRTAAMLRRKRGAMGDVRYVFTALLGLRAAKKELAELEGRQVLRQTSRKRHLVTLGRTAVTADALDHPALGKSREQLQTVEDERSKHAGAVAASDAELERVRRDREAKAKTFAAETVKTSQELAELAKKLEPLEKEAAAVRKRGATLRDQLRQIAKRVADTEALLSSIKGEKMDRANIQADIATLKADQKAIQRDEPVIAAEMDALEPRIAAIVAARSDAEKAQAERVRSETEDQRRTTELFEAIGAKRKVVERAAAEAEAARDTVLFDLGERLYVDRPTILGAQMSPIDQIDLEYGESARRINELREVMSNIDRWKIARGAAMILGILAVVGAFTAWLFVMLA